MSPSNQAQQQDPEIELDLKVIGGGKKGGEYHYIALIQNNGNFANYFWDKKTTDEKKHKEEGLPKSQKENDKDTDRWSTIQNRPDEKEKGTCCVIL